MVAHSLKRNIVKMWKDVLCFFMQYINLNEKDFDKSFHFGLYLLSFFFFNSFFFF